MWHGSCKSAPRRRGPHLLSTICYLLSTIYYLLSTICYYCYYYCCYYFGLQNTWKP